MENFRTSEYKRRCINSVATFMETFMETQFYLDLSSEDSKTYFPGNDTETFTLKLPEILQLKGCWEVALCAIDLPSVKPQRILICSDICTTAEGYHRKNSDLFSTATVYTLRIQEVERITIYIKSGSGETLSLSKGSTSCKLHFRHVKQPRKIHGYGC